MVVFKILGGIIFVLGLAIAIGFPFFGAGGSGFQAPALAKSGIFLGGVMMIVGFLMAYFLN